MSDCKSATPSEILLSELMDSRVPKNEREHFAAREINRLRARVAELEAHIAETEKQEPVGMVVHHNPPFGVVYKVEWYTKYRDLPNCTKLYTHPLHAPVAAVPDVDSICNAYESGVGHRGRSTASVNPYPVGSHEHKAYALGAAGVKNGDAA